MSIADRLANEALAAAERATDDETQRKIAYIFEQAASGTREDNDLLALQDALHIHTRSL